jgi:hypothetical protein
MSASTRARLWLRWSAVAALAASAVAAGCSSTGRLAGVTQTISPGAADSSRQAGFTTTGALPLWSLFTNDTLIGFVSGTGDSTRRYLGRLRKGYTADTLNIILSGDNRPAYRTARLKLDFVKVEQIFSLNPLNIVRGLIAIPTTVMKGMYPDLALVRDVPDIIRKMPVWGREQAVVDAIIRKVDSLEVQGQVVAAMINTGDLVKDGRYPQHWERFLRIVRPLSSKVPYFPIAGNHERTDTPEGIANWRTATGLPVGGDRLYYCFDSADGWVRFLALDSNPMTDPANHWPRDVEIKYSDEQIDWLVARIKEHRGPAFVFLHHPPFSSGYHRVEWQSDPVLQERRERMVRALHEGGIGIIASGHEHAYERALLTWPDGVLINIVAGGAGSPLHDIPSPAQGAQMFAEYRVAGSTIKPENVLTGAFFHFVHLRLWFGGGDFTTYAVEDDGSVRIADHVQVDLKRYGVPKIDQKKMPVMPEQETQPPPLEESSPEKRAEAAKRDSTLTGPQLETTPPPGRVTTPKRTTPKRVTTPKRGR